MRSFNHAIALRDSNTRLVHNGKVIKRKKNCLNRPSKGKVAYPPDSGELAVQC